jgi:cell wall-associated NlpC family hydrolase
LPHFPYYPHDWHLHRVTERYLEGVLQYAKEIESLPRPADIVLWKFGRCYSHGAIVVEWPRIIHAYCGRCCTEEDAAGWLTQMGQSGKKRPLKFFSVL